MPAATTTIIDAQEAPADPTTPKTSVPVIKISSIDVLPSTVPAETEKPNDISKYSLRKEVWTMFDKMKLALFPIPVRGRIPNFRGAKDASEKLASLPIFQEANVVKVSVDKPQEGVRQRVLQAKKRLVESPRRGTDALQLEVVLPEDATQQVARAAATRVGMEQYAKPITMDTQIKIDLYVIGSVAVSRTGQRIGKCDNYTDLEFGVLTELGMITEDTIIATTVHDKQIFDALPNNLFTEHDIPVDWIITPTEVIEVPKPNGDRPKGILWHLLSERRLKLSDTVTAIRNKLIAEGKECHLKDVDTDEETEKNRKLNHQPIKRFFRNHPRNNKWRNRRNDSNNNRPKDDKNSNENTDSIKTGSNEINNTGGDQQTNQANINGNNKQQRPYARNSRTRRNNLPTDGSNDNNRPMRRRGTWGRPPLLFSLRIGNISNTVRVRDLKKALAERNVKPSDITWRGRRGFALVHFAKPRKPNDPVVVLDAVVASLKDMKLGGSPPDESKQSLLVEPANSPKKASERSAPVAQTPVQTVASNTIILSN